MSALLDLEPHAAAIKAAINAQMPAPCAYDLDEVPSANGNPGSVPRLRVVITVSRMFGGNLALDGSRTTLGVRLTTRAVGKTTSEVRDLLRRTAVALEGARLTVAGVTSTPIQFEAQDAEDSNDSWRWAGTSWTYTL